MKADTPAPSGSVTDSAAGLVVAADLADTIGPAPFPIRVAAIDIGSNAIRFLAAEFIQTARYVVLEQVRAPVRLGHDTFLSGRLAPAVIDAGIEALSAYAGRMKALGIARYSAVATSAVRDSDNADVFIGRAREQAGIDIEIITGAEEMRLVHQAVRNRMTLGEDKWVLADLGGGSVEVALVDDNDVHWSVSHGMGSVRLLEELQVAGDEPGRFRRRLAEYTATLRIPAVGRSRRAGFIATGGNIETLARLAGAEPDALGVSRLGLEDLRNAIEMLARMPYRQRVDQLGLRADRADVILPAATVYETLCVQAGFDIIHVPYVGVKDGILLDLVDDYARHEPHVERQEQVVLAGAIALGRRYRIDTAHGRHVARLAISLFEQLRDLHGLDDRDRRILIAAAVLHDIGLFIGYRRHHKHSLYIISQSELPGLNPREILMTANLARYHRKGEPAPHHESFNALSDKEKTRVVRLACLLRVADGLDREHHQSVRDVRMHVENGTATLEVHGSGDMLLERWAVQKKATLFESTFDLKLRFPEDR
ncbi:MAG: Ppx/GppA phosphatase family protein [Gemmatimonadota bacterium]|jgi:exopolyphosphatase/guanosine-5'-triphosphate,3'-diphosphate pyrophosphatase